MVLHILIKVLDHHIKKAIIDINFQIEKDEEIENGKIIKILLLVVFDLIFIHSIFCIILLNF